VTAKAALTALTDETRFCLCLNLRMAAREVTAAYDAAARPFGLRATQFSVLGGAAALGPVPLGKLAAALALDKTSLPRNLLPLVRRGLIAVERGEDRRSRVARLTPAGEKVLRAAYPGWRRVQDGFAARLRGDGLSDMLGRLRRVRAAARAAGRSS
jgi:DNA-binding MarR family transcriptional regulator